MSKSQLSFSVISFNWCISFLSPLESPGLPSLRAATAGGLFNGALSAAGEGPGTAVSGLLNFALNSAKMALFGS